MATFAQKYPTWTSPATNAALMVAGREMQAANTHRRAVRAAIAQYGERRTTDRRINHTTADLLAFADRRHSERRFSA